MKRKSALTLIELREWGQGAEVDRSLNDPTRELYGKAWQPSSYGPDRDWDPLYTIDTVYDATNGTRSSGNIMRMGP
jgi:hypothetical protein